MRRHGAGDFALGLVLKTVLGRLEARRAPVAAAPRRRPRRPAQARTTSDVRPLKRGPLLGFMLASGAVGVILMVLFEYPVTRIFGVGLLVAFIVSGVFLIADPAFLGPDEDVDANADNDSRVRSRARRGEG